MHGWGKGCWIDKGVNYASCQAIADVLCVGVDIGGNGEHVSLVVFTAAKSLWRDSAQMNQ